MRNLLLVALFLQACGSKNDDDPPALAEVGIVSTPSVSTYPALGFATASFTFTTTGNTAGHTAIAALNTNGQPPADCKTADNIQTSPRAAFLLDKLKLGTSYGMRVCMQNAAGTQSTGVTAKFDVPAQ